MTKKVLIVEDEPLVRMLAVDVVEDAGFEAVEAGDADEAIRLLETVHDIRILLTDIDMPGSMNGLRLCGIAGPRFQSLSSPARNARLTKIFRTACSSRSLTTLIR